jgi:hypothetical protein
MTCVLTLICALSVCLSVCLSVRVISILSSRDMRVCSQPTYATCDNTTSTTPLIHTHTHTQIKHRHVADSLCADDNEIAKGLSPEGVVKLARGLAPSTDSSARSVYSLLCQTAVTMPVCMCTTCMHVHVCMCVCVCVCVSFVCAPCLHAFGHVLVLARWRAIVCMHTYARNTACTCVDTCDTACIRVELVIWSL